MPVYAFRSYRLFQELSIQCSDTVGWTIGRASGPNNATYWFVDGDSLTGALHML